MKHLKLLSIIMLFQSIAAADISIRICEADGITPYNQRDIMVGEKLVFVIRSNDINYGSGGLFLSGTNRNKGMIDARIGDPNTIDCEGSHTVCAGDTAKVIQWSDATMAGCDIYGSNVNSSPGDWFMLDYTATAEGSVDISFYDYSNSWSTPQIFATLTQVKTRDFNEDKIVNLGDYCLFEQYWQTSGCTDPNTCGVYDLDEDTYIDLYDLCMFSDFWLHGAPDKMGPYFDETVRYSIGDPNNNMINMNVGDSIRLYVKLETTDVNDISVFDFEVQISDPNNGWIYMSSDPNAPTEMMPEILATPTIFSSWNPGTRQAEGIEFFAANMGSAVQTGQLASFVYTCTSTDTTVLNVLNISSSNTSGDVIYPAVEDIVINPTIVMEGSSQNTSQSTAPMTVSMDATAQTYDSTSYSLDTTTTTTPELSCEDLYDSLIDIYKNSVELQEEYTKKEWDQIVSELTSGCN